MVKTTLYARDPLLRGEGRGGEGRDHGSHRPAGGLRGVGGWEIAKRPWVSQARWGDRVMVADTMVISSRVLGLLQTPWISY